MNRHERAKARALARVQMVFDGDRRFARGMAELARREPATVLSPRQRYTLDMMVYRYRRQLFADPAIQIPDSEPILDDYLPRRRSRQMSLLG